MALLRSVLGTITQSMGGVTATTWKGKNVLKQKVAETNTSNTPAQAAQRRKFAALASLGGLFGPAIRIGYRVAAASVTEQNAFYTANKMAVTDDGTTATVDYAALKLSTGTVAGVVGLDLQYTAATGEVNVTYTDNSNGSDALPTDGINVQIYDKVTGAVLFTTGLAERDSAGVYSLSGLPIGLVAANLRAYAFFKRASSTATSPSSTAVGHA